MEVDSFTAEFSSVIELAVESPRPRSHEPGVTSASSAVTVMQRRRTCINTLVNGVVNMILL